MKRNPFFHSPAPDEAMTLRGFLSDLVAGVALMYFLIGAMLVLAGVAS